MLRVDARRSVVAKCVANAGVTECGTQKVRALGRRLEHGCFGHGVHFVDECVVSSQLNAVERTPVVSRRADHLAALFSFVAVPRCTRCTRSNARKRSQWDRVSCRQAVQHGVVGELKVGLGRQRVQPHACRSCFVHVHECRVHLACVNGWQALRVCRCARRRLSELLLNVEPACMPHSRQESSLQMRLVRCLWPVRRHHMVGQHRVLDELSPRHSQRVELGPVLPPLLAQHVSLLVGAVA